MCQGRREKTFRTDSSAWYCWFQFRLNIPSEPWVIPRWFSKVSQPLPSVSCCPLLRWLLVITFALAFERLLVAVSLIKPPQTDSLRGRNAQKALKSTVVDSRCGVRGRSPQPLRRFGFYNHQFLLKTQFKDTLILYWTLDSLQHVMARCFR